MIGGSIRVPVFQKVLREGLHRDVLDMHMNGDETVAMGSVFRAANLSTAFKPRFVGMTDISPFSVGVELYRSGESADQASGESTGESVEDEKQQHGGEEGRR